MARTLMLRITDINLNLNLFLSSSLNKPFHGNGSKQQVSNLFPMLIKLSLILLTRSPSLQRMANRKQRCESGNKNKLVKNNNTKLSA